MSDYQAAWAYLQGALEALTPLVADLSPAKLKERLEDTIRVGRGLSAMDQMPILEDTDLIDKQNAEIVASIKSGTNRVWNKAVANASPGSVFFPHDLQRTGNGTFTPPEPTEEEIEELLKHRTGQE